MKTNIGDADRVGRLMAGATLTFIYVRLRIDSALWTALGVFCLYLLTTALFAFDPLYAVLRTSTRRPTDADSTVKKVD